MGATEPQALGSKISSSYDAYQKNYQQDIIYNSRMGNRTIIWLLYNRRNIIALALAHKSYLA